METPSDPTNTDLEPGDEAPPGTPNTSENLCPHCGGKGMRDDGSECPVCGGTGTVNEGVGGG